MLRDGKLPLMIVEDDANIRFLMEAAARRLNSFELMSVHPDGQAALDALRACAPHQLPRLIVSDLSMPRMTGMELLKAVKGDAALRNIAVAIITSSDVANDRELALAAGACSFVPKPFGLEALVREFTALHELCREAMTTASAV